MKTYKLLPNLEMMQDNASIGIVSSFYRGNVESDLKKFFDQGWRLPTVIEARLIGELAMLGLLKMGECRSSHGYHYGFYWTSEYRETEFYKDPLALGINEGGKSFKIREIGGFDSSYVRLVRDI